MSFSLWAKPFDSQKLNIVRFLSLAFLVPPILITLAIIQIRWMLEKRKTRLKYFKKYYLYYTNIPQFLISKVLLVFIGISSYVIPHWIRGAKCHLRSYTHSPSFLHGILILTPLQPLICFPQISVQMPSLRKVFPDRSI